MLELGLGDIEAARRDAAADSSGFSEVIRILAMAASGDTARAFAETRTWSSWMPAPRAVIYAAARLNEMALDLLEREEPATGWKPRDLLNWGWFVRLYDEPRFRRLVTRGARRVW